MQQMAQELVNQMSFGGIADVHDNSSGNIGPRRSSPSDSAFICETRPNRNSPPNDKGGDDAITSSDTSEKGVKFEKSWNIHDRARRPST